ncbi:MAG: carboxypeptidase-like regulatory domain-containing protein [Porphyromonadaceae bacterium]|nr:carboxypeptidase-like regulatory domain-containing protein [Porphyromonadaceae bacterium]
MDTNKNHSSVLILFFLFIAFHAFGQKLSISGRVLNQNSQDPVEYANVVLLKQDSTFLQGTTTDSIGGFSLNNLRAADYILSVSCVGFEPKKILIQNLSEPAQVDVFLNESMYSLNEVVISASSSISKINQRIVFPTKQQLAHSANGMQLLNTLMLPGLRVNPLSNSISSADGGAIILQINGMNATPEEIQTIQPRQIKRVEYSDYAGIRYGNSSKIVNYIVQRDDKGGVVGIDLMNSMNIWAGGDVVFAKFNRGKSEYALNYTVAFQDFKNNCRNRAGSFDFGSFSLTREEMTEGGDYEAQTHDISLGYNYQQNDSSFFNAKIKYAYTNHPHNDFKNALSENRISKGNISENVLLAIISLIIFHQQNAVFGFLPNSSRVW